MARAFSTYRGAGLGALHFLHGPQTRRARGPTQDLPLLRGPEVPGWGLPQLRPAFSVLEGLFVFARLAEAWSEGL